MFIGNLQAPAWEVKAAQKIDDLLESFLGIRDPDLGKLLKIKDNEIFWKLFAVIFIIEVQEN